FWCQGAVVLAVGEGPAETPPVGCVMSRASAQPDAPEHRPGQKSVAGDLPDAGAKRLVRALPLLPRAATPVREVVEIATTVVAPVAEHAAPVALEGIEVRGRRGPAGQQGHPQAERRPCASHRQGLDV